MKAGSLQEKIGPIAGKIQSNRGLRVLSTSFMSTLPALFIGAVLALIQGLPLGEWYTKFLTDTGISGFLSAGVSVANLIALFFIVSFGYHLAEMKKVDKFVGSIVALLCFMMITPLSASNYDANYNLITVENAVSTSWLGAQGLFSAIIVGVISINLYAFLVKRNIKIKMPDAVPSNVAKPFEALIPGTITALVFLLIRVGFSLTSFGSMHQFIYSIVQAPLSGIGSSFPALLLCMLITCFLWIIGIHGTLVIFSVMMPVWQPAVIENVNAFMGGQPLPYMFTMVFFFVFVQFIGGPGCLIGLTIDMPLFAKSKRYKAMGKIALGPGIFNIIEPLIFGFPIVLNPIMAIPFILTPLLFMCITYVLMVVGVLAVPVLAGSVMTIPSVVAGFLLGGGWQWGVLLIVFTVLSCIIYLPFLRICDRQALKEEQAQAELSETETAVQAEA